MKIWIKKLLEKLGIRNRFQDGYDSGSILLLYDGNDTELLEWVDTSRSFNSFDDFDRGLLAARRAWQQDEMMFYFDLAQKVTLDEYLYALKSNSKITGMRK